ncbi:MAG: hypothetical protein WCV86_00080 [Patescibacteria group bacterium]|jgi:hypothetical protein
MNINDTQDLFFLIAAIAVAVITFFTAWMLYYIVSMLRTANHVITSVDEKLKLIEGILHSLKANVSNGSATLVLLTKAVAKMVQFGIDKKNERKAKTAKGKAPSKGGSASGGKKETTKENDAEDFFDVEA